MNIFKRIARIIKAIIWDGEIDGKSIDDVKELIECNGEHTVEIGENVNELLIHEKTAKGLKKIRVKKNDVVHICENGRISIMSKSKLDTEYEICEPEEAGQKISSLEAVILELENIDLDKECVHLFRPITDARPLYVQELRINNITASFKHIEKGMYLIGVFGIDDNPTKDYPQTSFLVEKK